MECITEALHEPMAEVNNRAALLHVERYPGEQEDTFRTRVAYAMLVHYFDGKVSPIVLKRIQAWETIAKADTDAPWFEKIKVIKDGACYV